MSTKTILCLFLFPLLLACSAQVKDNPNAQRSIFTAKVNGSDFAANEVEAVMSPSFTGGKQILITGDYRKNGFQRIGINLNHELAVGSYTINQTNNQVTAFYEQTINDESKISQTAIGQLTISEFDKNKKFIKGTFNFSTTSIFPEAVVTITDGKFEVYYSEVN